MSYINKNFVNDDLNVNIINKSVYDLNGECVLLKYDFQLEITSNFICDHYNIEINKIFTSYEKRFIKMIKENNFIIVKENELFTDFKICGKFVFSEYKNDKIFLLLTVQEFR